MCAIVAIVQKQIATILTSTQYVTLLTLACSCYQLKRKTGMSAVNDDAFTFVDCFHFFNEYCVPAHNHTESGKEDNMLVTVPLNFQFDNITWRVVRWILPKQLTLCRVNVVASPCRELSIQQFGLISTGLGPMVLVQLRLHFPRIHKLLLDSMQQNCCLDIDRRPQSRPIWHLQMYGREISTKSKIAKFSKWSNS